MWKFEVENIGKVSRAEISMAPLMLLVGRNNTGKSYLAMVLWALTNASSLIWRDDARDRRPDWYTAFVAQIGQKQQARIEVTDDRATELIKYFNAELTLNGPDLLQEVFVYDGFRRTSMQVTPHQPFTPFHVAVSRIESTEPDKRSGRIRVGIVDAQGGVERHFTAPEVRSSDRIFTEIIYRVLLGSAVSRQTLYIPAARTGLMLSFRALVAQLFDKPTIILPRPMTAFLRRLSLSSPRRRAEEEKLATWLQRELMHGKIGVSEDEIPSFSYVPEDMNMSIPLHAASSMITELAPFMIMLTQGLFAGQIIFEEPEAHLHLSAQRSMARALARLVNTGVNVLVTSHSDTFVQQINNLMHLYNHPQKQELMRQLGYEEIDLINPAHARAYEFQESENKTNVCELKRERQGFVVPSLNDPLVKLANETFMLEEGEE